MKIEDAIEKMSKSYIERIVKSFTNDRYVKDEEGYKKQLLTNIDHLSKPETIKGRIDEYLSGSKDSYQQGLLINFILTTLLACNDYQDDLGGIIKQITKAEKEIIKKSTQDDYFKHIPEKNYEVFKTILEAALEDETISEDELHLIERVRSKISIHRKDQYLIQAKLKHFPKKGNKIHDHEEITAGLTDLQKCGVVFYCNKIGNQPFVIPEEMVKGVKKYLGIELVDQKFSELLDILSMIELKVISDHLGIKSSGKKDEIITRIINTGIKPSEALKQFDNAKITSICRSLPDVKVSGKYDEKIKRIIQYFDQLLNINVDQIKDINEIYYSFYEQLASLDMQNLIGKKIVKNEKDAANAFEHATNYLFEKKLNHKVVMQKGTDHSDGCLEFDNGELLLWDNKALMKGAYSFPASHVRQFKKYIRDSKVKGRRVNCFLIVVPDFQDDIQLTCEKLKYESGSDTDISIISAANLKWLAEEWTKNYNAKKINLQVFNKSGTLSKSGLKSRIKMFN